MLETFDPFRRDGAPRTYMIFDDQGLVGQVAVPSNVRVSEILPDRVLGVRTDSLGLQELVVLRVPMGLRAVR